MSAPVRAIRCPACGGKSVYGLGNPHRPFCSARCREHDFGAWASESYRIEPARADESDEVPSGAPGAYPSYDRDP
jgi:endogenous inhibitor of DNA gyrase (YacG/DUF329 family)